jgi:hypothetical protein
LVVLNVDEKNIKQKVLAVLRVIRTQRCLKRLRTDEGNV